MSFFSNNSNNNNEQKEEKIIQAEKDNKPILPDTVKKDAAKEGNLAVDAFSSGSFVVVRALVSGARLEDIDVSVTQDTVTIKGKRDEPDDSLSDGFYYKEIYWGPFQKKILLPTGIDIDKIDATLHNGVLIVKILKLDKTKEEKVEIKAN